MTASGGAASGSILVGLPVGILALLVLTGPDVKAAFAIAAGGSLPTAMAARPKAVSDSDWEAARRQVRGPAIGLIVTAVLIVVLILLALAAAPVMFG